MKRKRQVNKRNVERIKKVPLIVVPFAQYLFITFCRDPNRYTDEYLRDVRWRQMLGSRFNYLDIGTDLVMKDGLNKARYDVWDSLFPISVRRWGRNDTLADSNSEESDEHL